MNVIQRVLVWMAAKATPLEQHVSEAVRHAAHTKVVQEANDDIHAAFRWGRIAARQAERAAERRLHQALHSKRERVLAVRQGSSVITPAAASALVSAHLAASPAAQPPLTDSLGLSSADGE